MGGCTHCGAKERCDDRKGSMFEAIDAAMARLYPTRRWGERDEAVGFGAGVSEQEGHVLAAELAHSLKASTFYRPGSEEEFCDFIYVLCMGREPCLIQIRDGNVPFPQEPEEFGGQPIRELYLRVCLSHVARLAGVQQVAMNLDLAAGADELMISEVPRSGVYDAPLLKRFQTLVALLPDFDVTSVDFGDISAPPKGYDGGLYTSLYGAEPDTANYLFFPQPSTMRTTTFHPRTIGRQALPSTLST
jgi:hypothetical protein